MTRQQGSDATDRGFRPIGSLINPFKLGPTACSGPMAATGNGNSANSEIMPLQTTDLPETGQPHFETGLERLSIARNVLASVFKAGDPRTTDDKVEELLPPALRSALQLKTGGEAVGWLPMGYSVTRRIDPDDARAGLAVLDLICAPSPPEFVNESVKRCLVATKVRPEELQDVELLISMFVADLVEFPADIVRDAFRHWQRTERWRPALADIRNLCQIRYSRRRNLRYHLEQAARAALAK